MRLDYGRRVAEAIGMAQASEAMSGDSGRCQVMRRLAFNLASTRANESLAS